MTEEKQDGLSDRNLERSFFFSWPGKPAEREAQFVSVNCMHGKVDDVDGCVTTLLIPHDPLAPLNTRYRICGRGNIAFCEASLCHHVGGDSTTE